MKTFLEILLKFIKMIVVVTAIVVELPIKLIALISFIILFIIMAFFAPIFKNVTCPYWWEVYGNYAVKWKHNWHIVGWVFENYDY